MKERILYKLNNFIIILIFGAAIFTPFSIGILEIDKTDSKIEKRKLSQLPEMPRDIRDIKKFPQSFESYYSDHFGLREWLAKYYKLAKYSIGDSPSKDVIIGENGWLFLGSLKGGNPAYQDPIGDVRNVNLYSQQQLKEFAQHMRSLNSELNDKGTKYLFVIAPNKHTIYFDQLPDYIYKVNDRSATDQLIEYLKKHTDVPVVDLRDQLIKAKERYPLYYKTDTHWNHYGANIAQYEIMLEIEKLFPNQIQPEVKKLANRTRGGGDLAGFIGVENFKEQDPYPIFEQTCTPISDPLDVKGKTPYTLICDDQKLNAVIFGDSFFSALKPYFSRKFKRSTYIQGHSNDSSLTKYIELEKPDIVIEEWVERMLPYVLPDNFMSSQYKQTFDKSNELIFSNDWTQLNFNNGLNLIDGKNGSLRLIATGADPIISFSLTPIKPNNEYVLHINMASSVQSTLQVFYSDADQAGYPFSQKNSRRVNIQKGDNDLYIILDYPNLGKHLRLDPISHMGEITIKSIVIKRVDNPF